MKQKIINSLIEHNNLYEECYENFAFKHDAAAVFELECEHYVKPLIENLMPQIFEDIIPPEGKNQIEDYLKFINIKYHNTVRAEIAALKNIDMKRSKEASKAILQDFAQKAIYNYKKSDEEKKQFIVNFHEKNQEKINKIGQVYPQIMLTTLSQLRNPRLQYMLVHHLPEDIKQEICDIVHKMDKKTLDIFIKTHFCYPLEFTLEDYHAKWLAKEKIHVKFAKELLGRRYDYAKLLLKMAHKNKTPILIDRELMLNGIAA